MTNKILPYILAVLLLFSGAAAIATGVSADSGDTDDEMDSDDGTTGDTEDSEDTDDSDDSESGSDSKDGKYTIKLTYDSDANKNTGTLIGSGTYEAGTKVTISAIPSSGYMFVEWEAEDDYFSSNSDEDGDDDEDIHDSSFVVTVDRDLEFEAEFSLIPVAKDPKKLDTFPSMEVLMEDIRNLPVGGCLKYELPESAISSDIILDNKIWDLLDDKDASLIISVMEGDTEKYSWLFVEDAIPDDDDIGLVKISLNSVPDATQAGVPGIESAIKDENYDPTTSIVIDFDASGKLPSGTVVRQYIGIEYAGNQYNLYYFNESENRLEFREPCVIDDEGYVTYTISHCSSYVLASSADVDESDKDNNTLYIVAAILSVIIVAGVVFYFVKMR